jgi:hypothetical protein
VLPALEIALAWPIEFAGIVFIAACAISFLLSRYMAARKER